MNFAAWQPARRILCISNAAQLAGLAEVVNSGKSFEGKTISLVKEGDYANENIKINGENIVANNDNAWYNNLDKAIAAAGPGDVLTVFKEDAVLNGLPGGVQIVNKTNAEITVNGQPIAAGATGESPAVVDGEASITRNGVAIPYQTLPDAVKAAKDGDVIEVLSEVKLNNSLVIGKSLKLNLGNNTITSAVNVTISVTDGSFTGKIDSGTVKGFITGGIFSTEAQPESDKITLEVADLADDAKLDIPTNTYNNDSAVQFSMELRVEGTETKLTEGNI